MSDDVGGMVWWPKFNCYLIGGWGETRCFQHQSRCDVWLQGLQRLYPPTHMLSRRIRPVPTRYAGPVVTPPSLISALIQHDPIQFDLNISRFIAHWLSRRPPAFPAELYTHFPHA